MPASRIREGIGSVSLATVKREIAILTASGYVISLGKGRGAGYVLTKQGELFAPVNAHTYCTAAPDERGGSEHFDHELLASLPKSIFSEEEIRKLDDATNACKVRSADLSDALAKKELDRFVIELSWKSSRIEGNTYTLLDTERLIREGDENPKHSHEEAMMILNHKKAFEFVYGNKKRFAGIPDRGAIEEVHRLLVQDLNIGRGMRQQEVGITGTRYRPLGNQHQIREALNVLCEAIGRAADPYSAGLIALIGISYIQPFEDGNKRTARLLANAVLMARESVPLSYRSVDEMLYRESILVFYEIHSLMPMKDLFMNQYLFAAEQYGVR